MNSHERDFLLLGPAAIDILEIDRVSESFGSGTVAFSSATLAMLGATCRTIATVAAKDLPLFVWMADLPGIEFSPSIVDRTLCFRNAFDHHAERTQEILQLGVPLEFAAPREQYRAIYFGSLVQDDISQPWYDYAMRSQSAIIVDMQGWTRVCGLGPVRYAAGANLEELLDRATIVKVDEHEAQLVFGTSDENLIWQMSRRNRRPKEVLLTLGARGAFAITREDGPQFEPPPLVREVRDPSGCGDVFLATYAFKRMTGLSIQLSLAAAALVAGRNCEVRGVPFVERAN